MNFEGTSSLSLFSSATSDPSPAPRAPSTSRSATRGRRARTATGAEPSRRSTPRHSRSARRAGHLRRPRGAGATLLRHSPGGGSAGLLQALRTEEWFREEVAKGDIIMIETGLERRRRDLRADHGGTCGGKDDTGCVEPLQASGSASSTRSSTRSKTPGPQPTAIRLVNSGDAFIDPSSAPRRSAGSKRSSRS